MTGNERRLRAGEAAGTRGATGFLLLGLGRRQHGLQLAGPGEAVGRTPAALPRPRMQAAVTGGRSAGTARPGRRRRGRLVALITLSGAEAGSEVCPARAAAAWQEDGARPPHSGGGTGPRAGRPGSCRSLEALPAPGHRRHFRRPGARVTSGIRVLRALPAPGRARWREAGSEAGQAGVALGSRPIILCWRQTGTGRRPLVLPCCSRSSPQTTRRRPRSSLAGRPRD